MGKRIGMPDTLFPAIMFLVAFIFGFLTWIAKNVWRDRSKTQLFALIAIISTLCLIAWAMIYL